MSKYTFGDIYLVKFHPSFGKEIKRYRPAIVVSSITNNIDSRFTTIVVVSTKLNKKNKYEVIVDNPYLDKQSSVLMWYIRTVDVSRLEKKIGTLSAGEINKCNEVLENIYK